jgi:hypothetical protein
MAEADPFLLLTTWARRSTGPHEAKGAPWHPHRGFETVSYILDGEIAHHDTNDGGGVIAEGDTQWMTAGGGILHDELPTEKMYRGGCRRCFRRGGRQRASSAAASWSSRPTGLRRAEHAVRNVPFDREHASGEVAEAECGELATAVLASRGLRR